MLQRSSACNAIQLPSSNDANGCHTTSLLSTTTGQAKRTCTRCQVTMGVPTFSHRRNSFLLSIVCYQYGQDCLSERS